MIRSRRSFYAARIEQTGHDAGEWRVIDGQPVGLDLDRLIAEHTRAALDFA